MRLNSEQAGAALAGSSVSAQTFDRTPGHIVGAAVANLKRSYPELLATLVSEEIWATALASWGRLNIPAEAAPQATTDVFSAEAWLSTGLLTLIDSGALVQAIVTNESTADLVKLRRAVQYFGLAKDAVAAETVVEGPTEADLDAEILAYYRTNPTGVVKSRMRREPDFAARINQMMSDGRI